MTKEDIISLVNLNDYNNILEKILEVKGFSEDVKNLLLNVLYKIETFYKDYETVKINASSKKQYIKNLLNTINNCEKIIIAKPNSIEDKNLKEENVLYKIDGNKIIVYENDIAVLMALCEFDHNEIIIQEKYSFYEKALKELLNLGYISNGVEVIRDFNGWSWDINKKEIKDINYNLIYQNMLMIFGNEFVNCIINNCMEDSKEQIPNNVILNSKMQTGDSENEDTDYIKKMENIISKKYPKELVSKIKEDFKKAILAIVSNRNLEEKNKILMKKQKNEETLNKMQDNKAYLEELTKIKKQLVIKIKKIDNIINDEKLLKEEYKNTNKTLPDKEKIFSPSHYANKLIIKRKEYLKEIDKINNIMKPNEFVKLKEELKQQSEFYDIWDEKNNVDELKFVINLQKDFLECMLYEMKKTENKKEILDLIFKLRYYEFLPCGNKKILEIEELKEKIEEVERKFINKACEKRVLTNLSEDKDLNYNILKNIFSSKIIELESIVIILKYSKNILLVEIYDADTIENKVEIKIDKKTELSTKLKKKIKLFIK